MGEIEQYILVSLIILGAILYIILGFIRRKKHSTPGSCCGCSFAENCTSKRITSKNRYKTRQIKKKECNQSDKY